MRATNEMDPSKTEATVTVEPAPRGSAGTRPRTEADTAVRPALSVIVPARDELGNVEPMVERVRKALGADGSWELVFVDDGSRDGTTERLQELERSEPRVRCLYFAEGRGQTSALAAGFRAARAPHIAMLDADLQTDPSDLPPMVAKLEQYDAVVGYRARREDTWKKKIASRIANRIRNAITGDQVRDTGCPLKVFRTEAILTIPLFEGMHRFFPTLLRWHGYSVLEVPVSHAPRTAGESKYGIWNRGLKAGRDLFAVRWMRSRIIRPRGAQTAAPPTTDDSTTGS